MRPSSIRRRRRGLGGRPVLLVALLVLVFLAPVYGCGSDEVAPPGDTTSIPEPITTLPTMASSTTVSPPTTVPSVVTTSGPPTTAGPATTEGPTTTSGPLSSAETRLPNGDIRALGFIDAVWESGGVRYLSIDYAEMLTGPEAIAAAVEAGYIEPGEDLPNDYFIRNQNPLKREFKVSPSVTVFTSTLGGVMDRASTWSEFKSFWASPPADATHMKQVPWWIERRGNEVIKISEQYLP